MLETIRAIAQRQGDGVEAVEARTGRPLQNARAVTLRDGVAVVPVTGPIFRYANLFTQISGATSLDVLAKDFTAALDDPSVTGIVLDINSPGGQAAGIADFAAMVNASAKPVIAFVDGMAASAAYWIASAASQVVISKSGMAGNVGAVIGINTDKSKNTTEIVSSQSPNKRPDVTTDAGRAQIQALVDAQAQVFIEDVATYRGMTPEAVIKDFNGGDMLTGAQAVAAKMADRVGTLEGVIASLQQSKSTTPGAARPSFSSPSYSSTGALTMKTTEELRAAHPDLCAALVTEALLALSAEQLQAGNAGLFASLTAQGAATERARIQAVESKAMPGHEKLIAELKFDGKTTGPEAAEKVLAAEQGMLRGRRDSLKAAAPEPVAHAAAPSDADALAAEASLPLEERCKARWERDSALRNEFLTLADFTAYERAESAGRVRVVGNR